MTPAAAVVPRSGPRCWPRPSRLRYTCRVDDAVVQALRQALAGRDDVRLAVLFGSTARRTAGPASDVDVAVLGRRLDILALARDLTRAVGREVQIVALEAVSYPMLQAIVRDGIVVAEHERGCAARWRSRALVDLDNDRAWFERMRDAYLRHLAADRPA